MATAHQSVKLSAPLVEAARREGAVFSRSIAGQLEHWARLGRAIEAAPGFTLDRVRAALGGNIDPSELTDDEWRLFDEMRFDAIAEPGEQALTFFDDLRTKPGAVGYDDAGRLVRVREDGSTEVIG